ncbi:MAG: ornithine cyclodeaminase family protein [Chloroflexaceae bacterium]|nr:ornithine cyclodeaminase family protein [Chloroflexaceae bacterium]
MSVRFLQEQDVRSLVGMADALEAVELSFHEQARDTGINEPRRRVHQPNGVLHLMSGALLERGYWGFKAYTTTRHGARFTVQLYHAETGALVCIMEANYLGQLRTGAASGIATRYLANAEAGILALFGSGYQAETQLEAIASVRPLREIRVYSRTPARREAFAHQMGERFNIPVQAVTSPQTAVQGADIVTTVSSSREPVFDGNDLQDGVHINAAGSNSAAKAELDATAVRRAWHIFTDDVMQARHESGDLIAAYERNALVWSQVRPLADVVGGIVPGRTDPNAITLFASHGIALWDIALAATVYERAEAAGVGATIHTSI